MIAPLDTTLVTVHFPCVPTIFLSHSVDTIRAYVETPKGDSLSMLKDFLPSAISLIAVIVGPIVTFRSVNRQIAAQHQLVAQQLEVQRALTQSQLEAQSMNTSRQLKAALSSGSRRPLVDGIRETVAQFLSLIEPASNAAKSLHASALEKGRPQRDEQAEQIMAHLTLVHKRLQLFLEMTSPSHMKVATTADQIMKEIVQDYGLDRQRLIGLSAELTANASGCIREELGLITKEAAAN